MVTHRRKLRLEAGSRFSLRPQQGVSLLSPASLPHSPNCASWARHSNTVFA